MTPSFQHLPPYPLAARKAIDAAPAPAGTFARHMQRGQAFHRARLPEQALKEFQQAAGLRPGDADAASACAAACLDLGLPGAAAKALEAHAATLQRSAAGCANLAIVAMATGDAARARELFRRALAHDGAHVQSLVGLARLEAAEGNWDEVLRLTQHRVQLAPRDPDAQVQFVDALLLARRPGDSLKAAAAARQALAGVAPALLQLTAREAVGQAVMGSWDAARHSLQQVPGDLMRAVLRQLDLQPAGHPADTAALYVRYAAATFGDGEWIFARALPQMLRALLSRPQAASPGAWLAANVIAPALALEEVEIAHIRAHADAARPRGDFPPLDLQPTGDHRLRIAWLMPRLDGHGVADALAERLQVHDRRQFALYVYTQTPQPRPATQAALRAATDGLIDVAHLADAELVARIRLDQPHLLIDLAADTPDARPCVAAARVAPVQTRATRGWPAGQAGGAYDAEWCDAFSQPVEVSGAQQVTLQHLGMADPLHSHGILPRPLIHTAHGQCPPPEAAAFIFGVAAPADHIDPDSFALWMRVLQVASGAQMAFFGLTPAAAHRMRRHARQQGIDAGRLRIARPGEPATFDLLLDPLRRSAAVAVAQAIAEGRPVLSCAAAARASRPGAALLMAAGLQAWICRDAHDYQQRAIDIATDPAGHWPALKAQADAARASATDRRAASTAEVESVWRALIERSATTRRTARSDASFTPPPPAP